eukprot:m.240475 g.240475  ORF g.240475 m.240475 type:complete len:77 (-) comp15310_c1_seq1:1158-1388(-)
MNHCIDKLAKKQAKRSGINLYSVLIEDTSNLKAGQAIKQLGMNSSQECTLRRKNKQHEMRLPAAPPQRNTEWTPDG